MKNQYELFDIDSKEETKKWKEKASDRIKKFKDQDRGYYRCAYDLLSGVYKIKELSHDDDEFKKSISILESDLLKELGRFWTEAPSFIKEIAKYEGYSIIYKLIGCKENQTLNILDIYLPLLGKNVSENNSHYYDITIEDYINLMDKFIILLEKTHDCSIKTKLLNFFEEMNGEKDTSKKAIVEKLLTNERRFEIEFRKLTKDREYDCTSLKKYLKELSSPQKIELLETIQDRLVNYFEDYKKFEETNCSTIFKDNQKVKYYFIFRDNLFFFHEIIGKKELDAMQKFRFLQELIKMTEEKFKEMLNNEIFAFSNKENTEVVNTLKK